MESVYTEIVIRGDSGLPLRAVASMCLIGPNLELILESSGGTGNGGTRNPDYVVALDQIVRRCLYLGEITGFFLASKNLEKLWGREDLRAKLDTFSYPISASPDSSKEIRLEATRAVSKMINETSTGTSSKRIRITVACRNENEVRRVLEFGSES